jgi:hypothetical protein
MMRTARIIRFRETSPNTLIRIDVFEFPTRWDPREKSHVIKKQVEMRRRSTGRQERINETGLGPGLKSKGLTELVSSPSVS